MKSNVDAVEVVRRKDCVFWKYAEGRAFCQIWDRLVENPDYYCASGRRTVICQTLNRKFHEEQEEVC